MRIAAISVTLVCLGSACALFSAPVQSFVVEDFGTRAPARIVILPVANGTLYPEGPELLRSRIEIMLKNSGYDTLSGDRIDEMLKEKYGITYGAQLANIEPSELAAAFGSELGADALLFTELFEWDRTRIVDRDQMSVGAGFQLVESASLTVIWRARHEVVRHLPGRSLFDTVSTDSGDYELLIHELLRDISQTLPKRGYLDDPS